MSLDFSYANCASARLHEADFDFSNKLESLVFHMMFVGVRELPNRVACETFYTRYCAYNLSFGRDLTTNYLSYADVAAFIGITTNASSMTDAAFKKETIARLMRTSWDIFGNERATLGDFKNESTE